ncbi:hypothetical protein ACJIZ3_009050 [Penstemon smallii]|uniref:Leucine-rich repeat-containing N-terminal plant-type domain-containing protein n=1 Tax=Penstemon smallii TaxID=265156 RepID=A0ABD3TBI9_9LAMI
MKILLAFPWLLLIQILYVSCVSCQCLNDQRSLLLQLKNNLIFDSSSSTKLVHWNLNVDCCNWNGIACDSSGHVISLELDNESINGGIENSTTLSSFKYLERLNLAYNSFSNTQIPEQLVNLSRLAYLNLSNAGFIGQIPPGISKIRSLVCLDLSNQLGDVRPLKLEDPNLEILVQNLTSLKELYLDGVEISNHTNDWWGSLSQSLPNLRNLSLQNCDLSGSLNPTLAQLQSLSVLHLDWNDLDTVVPDFFANLKNLTVLTLSYCELQGSFPETIFQVPSLQYLDLSNNMFSGSLPDSFSNLSMLSIINLSNCNLTGSIPYTIANLMELSYLDCSENFFIGSIPVFRRSKKLAYINLSHNSLNGSLLSANFEGLSNLSHLDLSYNSLTGSIPWSLFSLPSLNKVWLYNNKFSGLVDEFSTMNSNNLEELDLSSNELQGSIPKSLFKLERLKDLELSFNFFNGTLELEKLRNLRNLETLDLSFNFFNGTIELEKLQNLRNLRTLDLSYNNLSVVLRSSNNSEMLQFPNLEWLHLASCNLHEFPNLMKSKELFYINLSNNKITGKIPNWIWELELNSLNVSYNSLVDLQKPYNINSGLRWLDLHSNKLRGKLPLPPANAVYIDYSSNNFQETIPLGIGNLTYTRFVSLANNNLTGVIPTSLCNSSNLEVLDLSGNFLSGGIPPCLLQNVELAVLDLGRNNISGDIPDTISANCGLKTLDLRENNLEGKIPTSLANCKLLEVMNVGNNYINDGFPCIMKNTSSLRVLVLRSNKFYGNIRCPGVDQSWPNLQIIDIAFNSFSGRLFPKSIENWKGMTLNNNEEDHFQYFVAKNIYYKDTVTVIMKAQQMELLKILTVFTTIDFSSNSFEGEIPETIGQLSMLYGLNLSHNSFTGTIPESIGNLTQLGSLDLSRNQLTGEIPEKLTRLTFLSVLNLSYNRLVGKIPRRNQFQTFSAESYKGNERLCDFPLNKPCDHDNGQQVTEVKKEEQESSDVGFYYISAEVGFAVGLGFIFGPIMFSERWRKCYYKHVDKFVLIIIRKLRSGDNH